MATQASSLQADTKDRAAGERSSITAVVRNFEGVNLQSPRESIGDDEFAWLEGLIPIGPGNLAVVNGPGTSIVTIAETGAPTFDINFDIAGTDYIFAVWANGNAWIGPAATSAGWAKIATALFTSGQTAATQWSNLGLLIVDPVAGYYDWNVTTASTLTNLSGQVYNPVLGPQAGFNPTTVPALTVNDSGAGTGATVGVSITAVSAVITAAGTNYLVGDLLQLTGGTLTTNAAAPLNTQSHPTLITVTAVNAGTGAITGISFNNTGYYQTVPANPVAVTGGAGTAATFTLNWQYSTPFMITPGHGYVAPFLKVAGVASTLITFSTSGTILGTSIAVYASRAWIAIKRTVQFTDAGSYSSFANSGSAFTINDAYLHNNITALFAANNYLYIFGDTSVDVLSNVTVVSGVAQFSRINASASVGTSQPNSVFAVSRAIAFANVSGFYILSGATPQKISDKLDNLFPQINFAKSIYGSQIMVANVLCAAFLVTFTDTFVSSGAVRSIIVIFFRNKWYFVSQTAVNTKLLLNGLLSIPTSSNLALALYAWSGSSLYPLMTSTPAGQWMLKTKLWDGGKPIDDKQGINVGIACDFLSLGLPGLSVYVDTELTSVLTTLGTAFVFVQWINNANQVVQWTNNLAQTVQWVIGTFGYQFLKAPANNGAGKYIGITVQGGANVSKVHMLALDYVNTRRW